jgi:hypothetical protein
MNKLLMINLDLQTAIKPQLLVGAALFQKHTGSWPEVVLLNPGLEISDPISDLGMEVHHEICVQPHLAYIGISEPENAVGEPPKTCPVIENNTPF